MEQADAVPPAIELSAPQTFRKEGTDIVATINPRPLGDYAGLERADLFVLYMIRDSYPERPFFFSRTSGGYAEEMGFARYTVTVGLARKLMPRIPSAGDGVVSLGGEEWFDAATTRALWETAFKAPASLSRRTMWVDRPSAGIPYLYVRTGLELNAVLDQLGFKADAARIRSDLQRAAGTGDIPELLVADGETWLKRDQAWFAARVETLPLLFADFEDREAVELARLVRPNGRFVDIGANFGLHSVLLATRFPDLNVDAFEPVPERVS